MASLRQKADGRYFIDYRDENGVRNRINITDNQGKPIREPRMARAYFEFWQNSMARERQKEMSESPIRAQGGPRIADVVNYYREVYLKASNAAEATHAAAATHCEAFLQFCRVQHIGRIQQLSGEVIGRWLAELQSGDNARSARTATNYVTTIRTALNVALDAELIDKIPIRKWTMPRVEEVEKNPLTIEELRKVVALFHDRPIVQWMCYTGQRPSDARTLKFSEVDVKSATVYRPSVKVRSLRRFEICEAAVALVAREAVRPHQPRDYVFLSSMGKPWTSDGLFNCIKDRISASNFTRPVTAKMLRDSFATIMANDINVPLPELQILMGHSDIASTMKYVRARGARVWLDNFDATVTRP